MKTLKIILICVAAAALIAVAVDFAVNGRDSGTGGNDSSLPKTYFYDASSETDNLPVAEEDAVEVFSKTALGWGPGTNRNEKNQTTDSVIYQEKYGDLGAYFIFPNDEKIIYLTFDLGYENGYTPIILDALKENEVKATFFITSDYVNEAPDIIRRIIAEGHTLANHTDKHPSMPRISDSRAENEITALHERVEEEFDYTMTLFRFPMGEYSEHSINLVNELGYKSIFWSFAYKDWLTDEQPEPSLALEKLTGSLHDGAIYLLHAVSSTNAAIMDDFVKAAVSEGYEFALIDERLGLAEHGVTDYRESGNDIF